MDGSLEESWAGGGGWIRGWECGWLADGIHGGGGRGRSFSFRLFDRGGGWIIVVTFVIGKPKAALDGPCHQCSKHTEVITKSKGRLTLGPEDESSLSLGDGP